MEEKKILVVDDEKAFRDALVKLLRKEGYSVKLASGTEDALQRMSKEQFHLVLADIKMPGKDGIQLCEQIRKKDSSIVILAISGYVTEHEQEKIRECGFDGYLSKPVERRVLVETIEVAFKTINERT